MAPAAYVAEICRWWLLIALVLAAFGKVVAFGRFRDELAGSFPELGKAAAPTAFAIVAIESLALVLLLAGGRAGFYGMLVAAALFVVLTIVVALALVQDRTVVCRCFGGTGHAMSGYDLLRNGLLVAAALFGAFAPPLQDVDTYSRIALAAVAFMGFQLSASLQDVAALLRIKV